MLASIIGVASFMLLIMGKKKLKKWVLPLEDGDKNEC
jgi:hypothetical protein